MLSDWLLASWCSNRGVKLVQLAVAQEQDIAP